MKASHNPCEAAVVLLRPRKWKEEIVVPSRNAVFTLMHTFSDVLKIQVEACKTIQYGQYKGDAVLDILVRKAMNRFNHCQELMTEATLALVALDIAKVPIKIVSHTWETFMEEEWDSFQKSMKPLDVITAREFLIHSPNERAIAIRMLSDFPTSGGITFMPSSQVVLLLMQEFDDVLDVQLAACKLIQRAHYQNKKLCESVQRAVGTFRQCSELYDEALLALEVLNKTPERNLYPIRTFLK